MKIQCRHCQKRFRVDTDKRPTDVVLCPDCGNPVKTGKADIGYRRSVTLTVAQWLLAPAVVGFLLSAVQQARMDAAAAWLPNAREVLVYSASVLLGLLGFCLSLAAGFTQSPGRNRALLIAVLHAALLVWWMVTFNAF